MTNKISMFGTCCMIGDLNTKRNGDVEFKTDATMKIGTITQSSMFKLRTVQCGPLTPRQQHLMETKIYKTISTKAIANVCALYRQIRTVSKWKPELRMFRVSSELLPLFDHPLFGDVYDNEHIKSELDVWFDKIRQTVLENGIRIMTHPSQYTVVNSESNAVRCKAFINLEYHRYFMSRITSPELGSTINVHLNGRLDHIPEFDSGLYDELRPWLSFENEDKISNRGHDFTLSVCEKYNIKYLFDIHHHWVQTNEYLSDINELNRIVNTWQGIKPAMHISQPRALDSKKSMISHSDMIDDLNIINYLRWLFVCVNVDVEVEAKYKNLASHKLQSSVQG